MIRATSTRTAGNQHGPAPEPSNSSPNLSAAQSETSSSALRMLYWPPRSLGESQTRYSIGWAAAPRPAACAYPHDAAKRVDARIKQKSGGSRFNRAMNRSAVRKENGRSRIDEDLAFLRALRMAIVECAIAIDQSRATIDTSLAAIKLLDQLEGRPRDAGRREVISEP
jgi:hypothetical protein